MDEVVSIELRQFEDFQEDSTDWKALMRQIHLFDLEDSENSKYIHPVLRRRC